ncbi:MAG: hypothetical protein ABSE73_13055, partial [Planctomycetota bacterium]
SKCTAGVPPARGRLAGREDEGGRDARGTLWATHLLTCTQNWEQENRRTNDPPRVIGVAVCLPVG